MLLDGFHSFEFSRPASAAAAIALHLAIVGYFVATGLSLVPLLRKRRSDMRLADLCGGASTAVLGGYFILRFAQAGSEPLRNMFEIVALTAFFLALTYFVTSRIKQTRGLGAFAWLAIALVFLIDYAFAPRFTGSVEKPFLGGLLVVHILLVVISYAIFFMAAVAALMFLVQERLLKRHREPRTHGFFPPLESLRKLVNACVNVGMPLLTAGFLLGFLALPGDEWARLFSNPKVMTSLVLWSVMAFSMIGRLSGLLHGKRHFYLVLLGFALVVVTYIGLGVFEFRRLQAAEGNASGAEARAGATAEG